jgi:nucleotide-binding universal stress UspA family protein
MQTIITPTDFSDISLNAVNYAADMAMALNANLLILHAIELPINANQPYDESDVAEIEAEQKLNDLKENLVKRTNNKVSVQTKQVVGLIENEIIKICDYKNALAVVMATKGPSLKEHFFMESITVHLSKNLTYPVIAVPSNMKYKPVNKILLATDLENLYSLPVDAIIKIIDAFKAQLEIVHVYNKEDKCEIMVSRMSELTNYLKCLNPQFHFVYNTNVYKGIIDFAKQNNSDIILTIPKKRSFFYKSRSKQLLFNAPITIMTMQ